MLAAFVVAMIGFVVDGQPAPAAAAAQSGACTSVALTPGLPSPQVAGTPVSFTAQATGCAGLARYRFWLYSAGTGWTMVQPYSGASVWTWAGSGQTAGDYYVAVDARTALSTADREATTSLVYSLRAAGGCTAVSLMPSLPSPRPAGSAITFTAAAGGCAMPQYQFWVHNGSGWSIAQAYGSSATFAWTTTGLPAGAYYVAVWARQAGSQTAVEAQTSVEYRLQAGAGGPPAAPCTSVTLTPAPPSPQTQGTPVVFTAAAAGCGTPEYQFWLFSGGSWSIAQPYGAAAAYNWATTGLASGSYYVAVWARQSGSMQALEAQTSLTYVLGAQACTSVTLTPDRPSPQPVGMTVTFTATAVGCSSPEYRFQVYNPSSGWSVQRDWAASPAFAWNTNTTIANPFYVHVDARQAGSGPNGQTGTSIGYRLSICQSATVTPSVPSPQVVGTRTVTFTATSTGAGCNDPRYQFWVRPPGGDWYVAQAYGGASFNWNTADLGAGAYTIAVWVRQGATPTDPDSVASTTFALTNPTTVPVGTDPNAIAINSVTNRAYVTNTGSNNVTVIDGATRTVLTTVAVSGSPTAGLAIDETRNRVYVPVAGFLRVIDGATNTVIASPTIGATPNAVAVNVTTNRIYVADSAGTVSVIDGATTMPLPSITTGGNPAALAVNAVTNRIYVANAGTNQVNVIEGATGMVTNVAVGVEPDAIVVNATTNRIYTLNFGDDTITVINGATNATTTISGFDTVQAFALNATTNRLYVADGCTCTSEVSIVDLTTNTITTRLSVAPVPVSVAVDAVRNRFYVGQTDFFPPDQVLGYRGDTNALVVTASGSISGPVVIAVNPATGAVFVINFATNSVTIF
jgi:YVTN family beta-propeller protein